MNFESSWLCPFQGLASTFPQGTQVFHFGLRRSSVTFVTLSILLTKESDQKAARGGPYEAPTLEVSKARASHEPSFMRRKREGKYDIPIYVFSI
jgi:hypothetical protein